MEKLSKCILNIKNILNNLKYYILKKYIILSSSIFQTLISFDFKIFTNFTRSGLK